MIIEVPLKRKDVSVDCVPCEINKTVVLSDQQFLSLKTGLMQEWDFIRDAYDYMGNKNGVTQGIMALSESSQDGIFIDSEGYGYARYSAYVSGAKHLLTRAEYPSLAKFESEMTDLCKKIVDMSLEHQKDGHTRLFISDLDKSKNIRGFHVDLLKDMLTDRPEIESVLLSDDVLEINLNPKFLDSNENAAYRKITEEELEIICAKHVLWLHDVGGERADFSHCDLSGLDLQNKKLLNANFSNYRCYNTSFGNAEICFSEFDNADICNCDFGFVSGDECSFRNASIICSDFRNAAMWHANFTGADMTGTTMDGAQIRNACFDSTKMSADLLEMVQYNFCSENEEAWIQEAPVQAASSGQIL